MLPDESIVSEARFFVGNCCYSYPGQPQTGGAAWFFRRVGGRERANELDVYAAHFNCAEINSTFYRPASPALTRGWLAKTGSDFNLHCKGLGEV